MISRPDIIDLNYKKNQNVIRAYDYATSDDTKSKVDWEKATWYFAPNDDGFI